MLINPRNIPVDLSATAVKTLCLIYEYGPTHSAAIARATGVTTASICQMVSRLITKGHIVRRNVPGDARFAVLELTQRGSELVDIFKAD